MALNSSSDTDTDTHALEESESDIKYWREGPDLVIERNKGQGHDVEVEVRKNVFTDCGKFEEAARYVKRYVLESLKGKKHKKDLMLSGHSGHPQKN